MAGEICPIFERTNGDEINLIGAWMLHPVNLDVIPDSYNFMEIGHIGPMLSKYVRSEPCRKIPVRAIEVGRGCKFLDGAFIMGHDHPAPNEPGGEPGVVFSYDMKQNDGVIILVRNRISSGTKTGSYISTKTDSDQDSTVTKEGQSMKIAVVGDKQPAGFMSFVRRIAPGAVGWQKGRSQVGAEGLVVAVDGWEPDIDTVMEKLKQALRKQIPLIAGLIYNCSDEELAFMVCMELEELLIQMGISLEELPILFINTNKDIEILDKQVSSNHKVTYSSTSIDIKAARLKIEERIQKISGIQEVKPLKYKHNSNDIHAIADRIKELKKQIESFPKAAEGTKEYYSQVILQAMAGLFLNLFEAKSGIDNNENLSPEEIKSSFKKYGHELEELEEESNNNRGWMDKDCYTTWRAQLDTLWEIYRLATGRSEDSSSNSPAIDRAQKKGTSHQHLLQHLVGKLNAPKWKFWVSTKVKIDAARALVEIGQEAHPYIINALTGPSAAFVSIALKEIGTEAIPVCISALNTPAAPYATIVFKEIGESGVDELIKQFNEESSAYACLALRDIGRPALPKLIDALSNGDENIRMWSALTLGEMGTVASVALSALRNAQQDHNEEVCQAATESIEKIAGRR